MMNYQTIFNLKIKLKSVILLLFVALNPMLCAKSYKGFKVQGNLRIESVLITRNAGLKPKREYDKSELAEALDKIYKTGYFSKVRLKEDNGYLIILVKENPTINNITKDGAKISDIEKENFYLKENQVFSYDNLKRDTIILNSGFTALGNLFSRVSPRLRHLNNNRIDVDFQISKSASASIHSISFIGNKHMSDKILRLNMSSKSDKWYNITFVGQTSYSAAALESDRDKIQKFYNFKGYLDAFVEDMLSEYLPSTNGFYITIFVHEGKKYKIDKIEFSSNVENLDTKDLKKQLEIKPGDDANIFKIRAQKYLLKNHAYKLNFKSINVLVKEKFDRKNSKLNLVYEITQREKLVIREIRVKGNDRTRLNAIMKCIKVKPGDILDNLTLSESQQRLLSLRIFESAQLISQSNGVPGEVDIIVDLKENPRSISLAPSASYTGDRGLWLSVSFEEKNLLGTGCSLEGDLQKDKKDLGIFFSYHSPFILGKNLNAGIATSFNKKQSVDGNNFKSFNFSLTPNVSYRLTKNVGQTLEAGFKYSSIKINTDFSLFNAEEGKFNNMFIGTNLSFNKLNSPIYPSKGYRWNTGFEINYLFSDDGTGFQANIGGMKAIGLAHRVSLELSANATILNKFNHKKHIRIFESLNNKSSDIRGFKSNGIGPQASNTSGLTINGINIQNNNTKSIGGNIKYTMRGELNFPLGLPEEWQSSGFVFLDAGSIINTRKFDLKDSVTKSAKIRSSAGIGFKMIAPHIGKIGIAYAFSISQEKYDKTKRLLFLFSNHVL